MGIDADRLLQGGMHPAVTALYTGEPKGALRRKFRALHGYDIGPVPDRNGVRAARSWEVEVFMRLYCRLAEGAEECVDVEAVVTAQDHVSAAGGSLTLTEAWVLARDYRSGLIDGSGVDVKH